jgi:tRNA/rRNA methyltransferase
VEAAHFSRRVDSVAPVHPDAAVTARPVPADAGPLDRIAIVLVAPSHPGNVGAVARAMKVMGLSRLAIVEPRYADVLTQPDAIAFASGAADVLERATVHATLDHALATTTHAIAMSARDRALAPPLVDLRVAALDSTRVAVEGGRAAFVFGSERYGLTNDDVLRCQSRCRIETSDDYGSLNLAQAVQLAAYECRLALFATPRAARPGDQADPVAGPAGAAASHDEREALIDHLEQALIAIGYLDPHAPKKLMPRLRRLFARARLEHDEVQWLRGIAKAMLRASEPTTRP